MLGNVTISLVTTGCSIRPESRLIARVTTRGENVNSNQLSEEDNGWHMATPSYGWGIVLLLKANIIACFWPHITAYQPAPMSQYVKFGLDLKIVDVFIKNVSTFMFMNHLFHILSFLNFMLDWCKPGCSTNTVF